MVATSLPFWMQHPGRVMTPFTADPALRLGVTVAPAERRPGARDASSRRGEGELFAEICRAGEVSAYEEAWRALAARALEPNVFLEPGFALPAIRHFPVAQRPRFLLVWRGAVGERADLVGLCALRARPGWFAARLSAAWTHEQATLAAPLLDRDEAGPVLDTMLDALAERDAAWTGLLLQGVQIDGPLMRLLAQKSLPVATVESRVRTVLRSPGEASAPGGSRRHAKERERQRRRLSEQGDVDYRIAADPDAVRSATERFLQLEARGWKGGRGTALLADAGLAAFTRAMTRRLARTGQCQIHELAVDGRPVAMGVVLRSGDRAFYWKTAYDETLRRASPGKQLAELMRTALSDDPTLALVDSCARADHAMIGHVWDHAMTVADIVVSRPDMDGETRERAVQRLRFGRACRTGLKDLYQRGRRALRGR